MGRVVRTLATTVLLIASVSVADAQVTLDVQIGRPPPAPRAFRVPPQPGPEFVWVEGYWWPQGSRYVWHNGYWTRPPYAGAFWIPPYWSAGRYVAGRWQGSRGDVFHDHRWDRSKQRDERRRPRGSSRNRGI
jgi:hypothetical protein